MHTNAGLLYPNWVPKIFLRLLTVFIALVILIIRMPHLFLSPQFWGEDGFIFRDAYLYGLRSIMMPINYLLVTPKLLGYVASIFPVALAPALYVGVSVACTLGVVWLVTSPRINLPYKHVASLFVVSTISGWEILLCLANTQWIAPVGALSLLMMTAHKSRWVLAAEAAFLALIALTGPFCFFLVPIYIASAYQSHYGDDKRRLIILAATVSVFGVPQALTMATHREMTIPFPYTPPDWTIVFNTPLRRFGELFYPINTLVGGVQGLVASAIAAPISAWIIWRQPYRYEKLIMAVFAFAILYSGMWRYRQDLSTLVYSNQRYVYVGSVFFVWTLAYFAIGLEEKWRRALCAVIIVGLINSVYHVANVERPRIEFDWATFAKQLSGGGRPDLIVAPATFPIIKMEQSHAAGSTQRPYTESEVQLKNAGDFNGK